MDIRFGELYTITTKPTKVTLQGQRAIHQRLMDFFYKMDLQNRILPDDWSWAWMVQEGEFRGKLPKRIASFFKKKYDVRLSLYTVSFIGNTARQYCHITETYTFDFTKCLDWMSGDFGDSGSCFWGAREPAREVLMLNGIIAVRFYRHGKGFARAWIAVLDEVAIVFNAYGLPCPTIAYVLSTLFNAPHPKKICINVVGDPDELIYLNGDTHAVGLGTPDQVTLKFDVPYKHCLVCDEFIHIEEYMHGEDMCTECYDAL